MAEISAGVMPYHPAGTVWVTNEYSQCSATPPECNAPQSELDTLGVSLDLDFDQAGTFANFRGSYFGLVNAVSGFVQPVQSQTEPGLSVTLGGPTRLSNGTTNVGSLDAFIPTAALQSLFGTTDSTLASRLAVTRTEGGTTAGAAYTATAVPGGLRVQIPGITFSTPVYKIVRGSGTRLSPATVGVATDGNDGYWLAREDGSILSFGATPSRRPWRRDQSRREARRARQKERASTRPDAAALMPPLHALRAF